MFYDCNLRLNKDCLEFVVNLRIMIFAKLLNRGETQRKKHDFTIFVKKDQKILFDAFKWSTWG